MPCMNLFEIQNPYYKEQILPSSVRARVAVEAGSTYGWGRYIGLKNIDGSVIGMRDFGESAPVADLLKEFGLTAENVVEEAKRIISRTKGRAKKKSKKLRA
jgi:transketolase